MTALPDAPPRRCTRVPAWALISAAWIGPAVLAAFEAYMQGRLGNRSDVTWRNLVWSAGDWLAYGLLTPAVFWFGRRYPIERGRLIRRIMLHLGAGVILSAAWAGIGVLLRWGLFAQEGTPTFAGAVGWFLTSLPFGAAVYFAVLGAEHAIYYFSQAQERRAHAARLSAQLAEARLGALRMQLQPHFLLNSLNALAVVLRDRDTATAGRMLDQLGEMLRRILRTDRPPEVTLDEEIAFLQSYLAIEEIRFPDRLRPRFLLAADLGRAAVPEFLLQPLVENAIRHGLARRTKATTVEVEARREDQDLVLEVRDDGPGPGPGPPEAGPTGVGLRNVRDRLQELYGDRASLTLALASAAGGAVATVRLPLRLLGADDV